MSKHMKARVIAESHASGKSLDRVNNRRGGARFESGSLECSMYCEASHAKKTSVDIAEQVIARLTASKFEIAINLGESTDCNCVCNCGRKKIVDHYFFRSALHRIIW